MVLFASRLVTTAVNIKERNRMVKNPNNSRKKFFVNKFFIVLEYLKSPLKVIVTGRCRNEGTRSFSKSRKKFFVQVFQLS